MTIELASTVTGQGPPAVILHGLFGSGVNWRSIARTLEARLQCHLVDQRNHGRSPHMRGMTYPALAADLLAYLDAHRIDRAGLIGHSMGGKTAMTLALAAPERVAWLIVADIAPAPSPGDHRPILDALTKLPIDTLASRAEADAALSCRIPEPGLRQFLLQNLVFDRGHLRWRIDLEAIGEALPDLTDFPPVARHASYRGPTLFLRGERSDYLTADHEPRIRTLFTAASITTITAAGHWLHAEQPAAVTARIEAFLREAATAAGRA